MVDVLAEAGKMVRVEVSKVDELNNLATAGEVNELD